MRFRGWSDLLRVVRATDFLVFSLLATLTLCFAALRKKKLVTLTR